MSPSKSSLEETKGWRPKPSLKARSAQLDRGQNIPGVQCHWPLPRHAPSFPVLPAQPVIKAKSRNFRPAKLLKNEPKPVWNPNCRSWIYYVADIDC
jgi:hypothetical protein